MKSLLFWLLIGLALSILFFLFRLSALIMTGELSLGRLKRRGTYRPRTARRHLWSPDFLHARSLLASLCRNSSYVHGSVLDAGCGHQIYRSLFPNIKKYIGLEWEKEITHPEVVGNCQKLPFKDRSFQSVLATQVLEHLPDPYQAVSEMARVLEGGGHLVITAPQAWRLHGMPHDYYRFTRFGLVYLMESQGLEVIKVEAQGGVWALLGQTFLNMVPHRNLFPLTTPVVLLVNTLCLIMDNLWYDPFDTLNYLIVGHKP